MSQKIQTVSFKEYYPLNGFHSVQIIEKVFFSQWWGMRSIAEIVAGHDGHNLQTAQKHQ